jgi:hypothetical protein
MNTIIVPERITGKDVIYPMGICGTDTNGTNPGTKIPIIKIGNSIDGKKINGNFDAWGTPAVNMIVGNGKYCAHLKAKIDTGAYHNHINSDVAKQMGLDSIGGEIHNTPYGKFELSVYRLVFGFEDMPDTHFVCDMRSADYADVEMLIGMQFIAEFCDLHIYGTEKKFELVFR